MVLVVGVFPSDRASQSRLTLIKRTIVKFNESLSPTLAKALKKASVFPIAENEVLAASIGKAHPHGVNIDRSIFRV